MRNFAPPSANAAAAFQRRPMVQTRADQCGGANRSNQSLGSRTSFRRHPLCPNRCTGRAGITSIGQHQRLENDGFVMPSATSRRLFAALLPLLAAEHAATLYPEARQQNATHQGFCPDGKGAVFSYRERDLWCVAHHSEQFLIGFPDQTFWTVSPIAED